MYLRFDVGVPACIYKKIRNEPAACGRGFRRRNRERKVTPSRPPSSRRRGLCRWRTSFPVVRQKIRYRQPDLFDPAKLTLIARRLLRGTLLSRSPLNRRLIDFSLFRFFFFLLETSSILYFTVRQKHLFPHPPLAMFILMKIRNGVLCGRQQFYLSPKTE